MEERDSSWSCRFTMVDKDSVSLPLRGCLRHLGAKRNSLFHASTDLIFTISLSIAVSLDEHICLADLGIRRRTLTLGMVAIGSDVVDGGVEEHVVAMAAMSVACVDGDPNGGGGGGRGGFPEPGHRAESGPCFLIKPLEVMAKDLRQAAQTADAILILCRKHI